MVVRELLTKIGFNLDNGSLNRAESATNRLKKKAQDTADSFKNILLGYFGVQAVKSLVMVGDEVQSIEARLSMLPQATDGAAAAFDHLVQRANNARQSLSAYSSFYIKAGNATQDFIKDQETLTQVVDGASFGLAASGSTAVAQSQAFFQLGQAIGSPTVQMEEMNTLIDVAPDLFRALGKAIPGADGNLKKFISTGKVTGKMLAEGLIDVMPQFEKQMLDMPLSTGQAFNIVGNNFSRMIARMNRESKIIPRLAAVFIATFEKIEKGIDFVIEKFDGWENALRFLGAGLMAAAAIITGFLLPASWAALLPWVAIGAAILVAAAIIDDLIVAAEGGNSVFLAIWNTIKEWGGAIETAIIEGARKADEFVTQMVDDWANAIYRMFVETIPKAIRDAFNYVTNLPSVTFEAVKNGLTGIQSGASQMSQGAAVRAQNAPVNVKNETNVNLTVPAGTSDQQAQFLTNAARKSFSAERERSLSTNDMLGYQQ